ncbi:MAG: hypothetical protein V4727_05920 [Verrucomicrobiota bacterium]
MSNDSQLPENPPDRDSSDLAKDYIGFEENDLWELDDHSPQPSDAPADSEKSYGVMEKNAPTEDLENSFTPTEPSDDSPGFFSTLTMLEKTSMFAIVVVLIITTALGVMHFSKEIPVDSEISKKVSLPVEGKILTISAVETYWRTPNTQGENPDIVRRGVKLIPVIKIQAKGTSGAIRIFFRDSDGILVGDSTTLAISGDETLNISATDGFTDMGMHASYRTGENARWMIQALEGPAIDAPIEKFKSLFETEISTDIR